MQDKTASVGCQLGFLHQVVKTDTHGSVSKQRLYGA